MSSCFQPEVASSQLNLSRKVPFQGEGDIISLVLSGKRPSLDEVPSAVRELMVLGWDADAKKRYWAMFVTRSL